MEVTCRTLVSPNEIQTSPKKLFGSTQNVPPVPNETESALELTVVIRLVCYVVTIIVALA